MRRSPAFHRQCAHATRQLAGVGDQGEQDEQDETDQDAEDRTACPHIEPGEAPCFDCVIGGDAHA